jgi:hypothetical protein
LANERDTAASCEDTSKSIETIGTLVEVSVTVISEHVVAFVPPDDSSSVLAVLNSVSKQVSPSNCGWEFEFDDTGFLEI